MREPDVIIVGAGVAGLSCARELAAAGARPMVLERSRGVGGRCATRRVAGQPVDHGVLFLHGADPEFAAAVEAVHSPRIEGWPGRVTGSGAPCQPEAFSPGQRRWAFAEGISAFPKALARPLEVRLNTDVAHARLEPGGAVLRTAAGESFRSRTLVLTLPLEQTAEMLHRMQEPEVDRTGLPRLLRKMSTAPCLTLLAGYPREAPPPAWDVCYPESSAVLQLISHDSAKRPEPRAITLVCQARPRWSRRNLEEPPERWGETILKETADRLGGWAARPDWVQTHRWRHARLEAGTELTGPVVCSLPGGVRLGLAGELFSPGGGVEAAWKSGRTLARRLMEEGGE